MRAMRAEQFSGYEGLKLVELPKPAVSDGKVLLRLTAAGVTPLEQTILSGQYPRAKSPLILQAAKERAWWRGEAETRRSRSVSRVMFTGPYGVFEDGRYSELAALPYGRVVLTI